MSLNTNPLVQAPPKSGKPTGGSGEVRDNTSGEAGAQFRSVLKGMKDGGEQVSDEGGKTGARGPNQDSLEQPGEAKADASASTGENSGSEKDKGAVAFATSNLTDALRKVSQNVLAQSEAGEVLEDGAPATETPNTIASAVAQTPAALVRLTASMAEEAQQYTLSRNAQDQSAMVSSHQASNYSMSSEIVSTAEKSKTGTSSLFAQFGIEPERTADMSSSKAGAGLHLPEESAGNVKVLRQETHFAPNMRLSPAQQVGDQVTAFLRENPVSASSQQPGLSAKAEGPVLKTLDIQLTPHELGSVKVSLKMVGDSVEVTLLTSKTQTAELLKQDRQLLDQMLRTTGFKADTITVQVADDRLTVQTGNSTSNSFSAGQNGSNGSAAGEGQGQSFGGDASSDRNDRSGGQQGDEGVFAREAMKGQGDEVSELDLSDGIYL